MPPSHCKIALQISILFGASSKLVIIVDPVVVIPDILSKKASTNDKLRLDNKNGKHPKIAILNHDKVVRRKACCKFSFLFSSRFVSTRSIPINAVTAADDKKDDVLENTEFKETRAPSRPKKLDAKVVRFQNNKEKWIAVVGLMNGRPYEIFTGKTEDVFVVPQAVEYGWVIKTKKEDGRAQYDFQYEDKEGYKITMGGLSRSFDKEFWNYAKLISGVLRHGMPLHYVVDLIGKMNLYDDNINTWKSGVVRALKTFIPDGTKVTDNTCGECGDEGLVYEEGCLKCVSCGYSKCG